VIKAWRLFNKWGDTIDIVKRHFPKKVESGHFPLGGTLASNLIKFDATRTEDVFGIKFKSFEEQVVRLAGWYAEVSRVKSTEAWLSQTRAGFPGR
jgi:hypothetical protein